MPPGSCSGGGAGCRPVFAISGLMAKAPGPGIGDRGSGIGDRGSGIGAGPKASLYIGTFSLLRGRRGDIYGEKAL
jgi:hypothetical protein